MHKFQDVLRWIADGKQINYRACIMWHDITHEQVLTMINIKPLRCEPKDFRISPDVKPDSLKISTCILDSSYGNTVDYNINLKFSGLLSNYDSILDLAKSKVNLKLVSEHWYNDHK